MELRRTGESCKADYTALLVESAYDPSFSRCACGEELRVRCLVVVYLVNGDIRTSSCCIYSSGGVSRRSSSTTVVAVVLVIVVIAVVL